MNREYLRYGGPDDLDPSGKLTRRFVESWFIRATVRQPWEWQPALVPEMPDFLEDLLPFRTHPAFKRSSAGTKAACLSAGWLIYNYKTIAIETQIIIPACNDLMTLSTSRRLSFSDVSALAETVADEGYHTLISSELCRMTASFRGLDVQLPEFDLTQRLKAYQLDRGPRLFSLIRLAYATVSEVFISDYLSLLSEARDIQPLFRSAVALHKADEVGHRRLFPRLIRWVIQDCNADERKLFVTAMFDAKRAFSSRETRVWRAVLGQIYRARRDFEGDQLPDCVEQQGEADFRVLAKLLTDLRLIDDYSSQASLAAQAT
jgi:hypothetical protein